MKFKYVLSLIRISTIYFIIVIKTFEKLYARVIWRWAQIFAALEASGCTSLEWSYCVIFTIININAVGLLRDITLEIDYHKITKGHSEGLSLFQGGIFSTTR